MLAYTCRGGSWGEPVGRSIRDLDGSRDELVARETPLHRHRSNRSLSMTTELFAAPPLTAPEHIGLELGLAYAHYRPPPPPPHAQGPAPPRHGPPACPA